MSVLGDLRVGVRRCVADDDGDALQPDALCQKRHGLTPLDLARFIQGRVDAGDSNATVAKRLGMNLTTVAHHLALLELPPELDDALKSGRCTSPRTLNELSKLHEAQPEQARALIVGDAGITRTVVSAIGQNEQTPLLAHRARHRWPTSSPKPMPPAIGSNMSWDAYGATQVHNEGGSTG